MATQTGSREQPLNVVVAPDSDAAAAFESAALLPGFVPEPRLDLQYLGGRTLPSLAFRLVYLGRWQAAERRALDHAVAAAMADSGLNEILAQYFPGRSVASTFGGSSVHRGQLAAQVDKPAIEALVAILAAKANEVICLLLPRGAILADGDVTSEHGLAGYHGSVHPSARKTVYYAVAVYSEDGNGIVAFDEPWKNVCATLYHELQEVRTDPDVEDAIRAGNTPSAVRLLGWYSPKGGEIGDIPISESHGDLGSVMQEVRLADGTGTVPVQLMWSNRVDGPEGPAAS